MARGMEEGGFLRGCVNLEGTSPELWPRRGPLLGRKGRPGDVWEGLMGWLRGPESVRREASSFRSGVGKPVSETGST